MNKFIWEPEERLLPGDAPMTPRTTRDLLRLLDVDKAHEDVQYQAVKAWLYKNEPDALLHVSLVQDGFAPTVTSTDHQIKALNSETFERFPDHVSLVDALRMSIATELNRRNPQANDPAVDDTQVKATPAALFQLVTS